MKQIDLDASIRTATGKGVARKLRAAGDVPAILYGPGKPSMPIAVSGHSIDLILKKNPGEHILFTLNLKKDGQDTGKRLAMIKMLQFHPVSEKLRHVDFYEVSLDKTIEVDIPLVPCGKAKGVEIDKGILEIIKRTVKVKCLPTAIPKEIKVDITNLRLGQAIHISDIQAPEGVKFTDDPKTALITIVGTSDGERAAPAAEETAEAAPEAAKKE
ncbi:MAG: 50S ribosomal protein L25 [Dissulfuribacterales bacterium]